MGEDEQRLREYLEMEISRSRMVATPDRLYGVHRRPTGNRVVRLGQTAFAVVWLVLLVGGIVVYTLMAAFHAEVQPRIVKAPVSVNMTVPQPKQPKATQSNPKKP